MNDYIIRGTAANDQVRFFAAYTKDVVETARQKHNTSPVAVSYTHLTLPTTSRV